MTWEEIDRKRMPYIRSGERLFKGMYDDLLKQMLKELEQVQDINDMKQVAHGMKLDRGVVQGAMERFYSKTAFDWAKMIAKSRGRKLETKQEDDWTAIILEYVRTKKGKAIDSIISTHGGDIENIVRMAVEEGVTEGWGIEKVARSIKKAQGEMDLWKAMRIARTEVVNASNEGVKIGASELPGNKKKVWISSFTPTSRDDHMAMDGVQVAANEFFTLPNGNQLEYPGDSVNGQAGDVINCRCGWEVIVEKNSY